MGEEMGAFERERFGTDGPWLDLVNSEQWDGFGRRADHLDDPAWLAAFLARWGWAAMVAGMPAPLPELRAARTDLRMLAEATAAGESPFAPLVARLDALLAEPVRRRLAADDGALAVKLESAAPGWPWVLAETVASAAAMLAPEDRRRVKVCANPGCRWAFVDRTRGNTRRWCNDLTCGNRDKVRRFRERAKAAQAERG